MSLPREFLYELHKNFTGDIRTDRASRILYSTDASIYQIDPLGVVIPRTQEELHAAVELAVKYRIPILPRGAGTSLAGQAVGAALILDCSRWFDHIIQINPEEQYAIVEPGVVLSALNNGAAKHGLMYGPDPASAERATMGGVIANNATGAHSIVYGMSADHLISADVILGDGSFESWGDDSDSKLFQIAVQVRDRYSDTIKNNWTQTWRNSAGYRLNYLLPWGPSKPPRWEGEYPSVSKLNLAPLLAGSEGTLAVIRRMKVRLVNKPKQTILAVLSYESVSEACDDVPRLLTHDPSAIELIPRTILRAARNSPAYSNEMTWLTGDPAALLVVEFSGDNARELLEMGKKCSLDMPIRSYPSTTSGRRSTSRSHILIAESKEDQARVWNVRKVGLGLMDSTAGSMHPVAFIEDCAIPVERLGDFVRDVEKILAAHEAEGGMYAHASAGCLHIRPILDMKSSLGMKQLRSISEAVFALTMSLGGAMSSEHGDGLARSEYLTRTYGSEIMDAMRTLKDAADPHRLLNPGKIIDPPKMDENLRYGADYKSHQWASSLSFHREGSFELAVEQCNGQGVCRKNSSVMCPSFQGTREEMHSTRGRANLLRAMIAVPHPNPSYAERGTQGEGLMEATFEALDLCLACKGCKAECPSGVDMAKMKYEFENEYYKSHRRPLRDYLFGYFHVVANMLSPVSPLANALMSFSVTRTLIAKILGLAEERPLPKIQRKKMSSRGGLRREASNARRSNLLFTNRPHEIEEIASPPKDTSGGSQRHVVIYLPDVFSRYIEPQVEQAALDILQICGYDVRVLPIVGAGASFLSKGLIEAAQRHARKTLEILNQADPTREAVIVGLEPPDIYLLKNDYADLLPGRMEEISSLERRVWLIDEFLMRSQEFESLRLGRLEKRNLAEQENQKLFFHPHCHQRAEGLTLDGLPSGANATVELLRMCGYEVELSDAGCCGLAGTFGFEAEHYELSMKIGELRLLPRLRELISSKLPPSLRDSSPREASLWDKYDKDTLDGNKNSSVGFGGGKVGVASTGAACRMQIRHGAQTEAKHPIEWVREAVQSNS